LIVAAISSYFLIDMLLGNNFEIESWNVVDNEGFPAISYDYSCSNYAEVKMFDSNSNIIDSDFFLRSEGSANINLGTYKQSITNEGYTFKAYTKEGDEIYSKSFNFDGPSLSINSCEQKWWVDEGEKILIGLSLSLTNTGDLPVYPYSIDLVTDSETVSGLVLPSVVKSGCTTSVDCTLYKRDRPDTNSFILKVKDIDSNILSSSTFAFEVEGTVDTITYKDADFDGRSEDKNFVGLSAPYPEFLFDYYSDLDRLTDNDYSFYLYDIYDDLYIGLFVDRLISTLGFGEAKFNKKTAPQKINFIADFVHDLEYKKDVIVNETNEYPNYPIETLFNRIMGCDCEDKAILIASILDSLNYSVALFRLPGHMAVGVQLSEDAIPNEEFYYSDYYYLETTKEKANVGHITRDFERDKIESLDVYEIADKPYLIHQWIDNVLTIYTNTKYGDFVKIDMIMENHGRSTANDITVEGVFISSKYNFELNSEKVSISSLEAGKKTKLTFTADIPSSTSTFESRIIYRGRVVNTRESSETFPT